MKHISIALFILISFTSCQKNVDSPVPVQAQTLTDVAYGTDAKQKMDVYLPANRSVASTKAIILIHGGAWSDGDKTDFADYMATLKQRIPDYAIFNINYRLVSGTTNIFPAQENDVKAAMDFIVGKSDSYKISQKIVLLGASAGGQLALLQAYKYTSPVEVKAVIDFFGPTDLTVMYNTASNPLIQAALFSILGATPASNAAIYKQSSPITFVNAQSPPTMILQGGVDPLVDPSQSVLLNDKLQAVGVVHQYVLYPTESHGWVGANLLDSFDKIQAFLNANVN